MDMTKELADEGTLLWWDQISYSYLCLHLGLSVRRDTT